MQKMTLMQHFAEMRRRILWTLLVFVVAFFVGVYFSPYIQDFLTAPLLNVWPDGAVLYSGLSDGLMISFSLGFTFALLVSLPVALWHIWAYIAPGLKNKERKFIWPFLVMSPLLFLAGAAFAFYVLFPVVFKFFVDLNLSSPVPALIMPAARDYLGFAIGLLKVFGIAFQLPLIMVLLNHIGMLGRTRVVKMRRYAIVAIAIIAAVLTPPDVVSQVLLGVPLYLLFEFSILFMRRD
ncbi:MAG: twin-arginine translocase subunit TatC [Alphaproteobacteria bacterium]|nr:twin-arginine translocase subunit TatC [Alphaproteobacteria bacterium]